MSSLEAVQWTRRTPTGTWVTGSLDPNAPHRWRRPAPENLVEVSRLLARLDFLNRYRAQALGVVWSVVRPLVTMLLLTTMLGAVLAVHASDYPMFVLLGVLFWQFVSRTWTTVTGTFSSQGEIAKHAAFPRYYFVLGGVLSNAFTSLIEAGVVLLLVPFFPTALQPGLSWLLLPVLAASSLAMVLGLCLATASLQVHFQDVTYGVETLLGFAYWLTPVFYPPEVLPAWGRVAIYVNPAGATLQTLRGLLMHNEVDLLGFGLSLGAAVVSLTLGVLVYRAYRHELPDHL